MISYMKSDLYRIIRNRWTYLFIVICSVLLVSANVVLTVVNASNRNFPYATTKFSISMYCGYIVLIFLLCIVVAAMIFGNEHGNHTLKNSVSYGIARGKIYFGKLLVEILYSLTAFLIITAVYIGTAYLLLEDSGIDYLVLLIKTCFAAVPLFLMVIGTTNCFLFIMESTGASITSTVGLLLAFPLVCNLLAMKFKPFAELTKFLPYNLINSIGFDTDKFQVLLLWEGKSGYLYYWLIGVGELLLLSIIGYVVFRKKEIK